MGRRHGSFEGPTSSWEEATAQSDGWDASVITDKTLVMSQKVRDGLIVYAQDTIALDRIQYSDTILAFIALALARQTDHLEIVDFGGSLGTNYFQNRKILEYLDELQRPIIWNVIERPILATLGKEHFANAKLKFFSSLHEAIAGEGIRPDAFLFSGSLQYTDDPFCLLDQVMRAGAGILAFDRLLVSPTDSHQSFIQHPDPEKHYPATYPVWCFSKDLFIGNLTSKGFKLIEHFTTDPSAHFDHCGMIFVRSEGGSQVSGPLPSTKTINNRV